MKKVAHEHHGNVDFVANDRGAGRHVGKTPKNTCGRIASRIVVGCSSREVREVNASQGCRPLLNQQMNEKQRKDHMPWTSVAYI